jgi:hypothetical protein
VSNRDRVDKRGSYPVCATTIPLVGRGAILALAVTIICGAFPGTAASWRELPTQGIGHAGVATCLRAAGDGQLAVTGAVRRDATPMTLLNAEPSGFSGARSISLGVLETCPDVATNSRGDSVLAGFARNPNAEPPSGGTIRAAAFGPGTTLDSTVDLGHAGPYVIDVAVAVDEQGQAIVAWLETAARDRDVLRAAVRNRDGSWGSAFDVVKPLHLGFAIESLTAAPDQSGGFVVAWTEAIQTIGRRAPRSEIKMATIRGNAATSVVGIARGVVSRVEARATPDGRILLVHDADGNLHLQERAPGAAGFAPLRTLGEPGRRVYQPAVSLRADGAALLAAWSSEPRAHRDLGLTVWMRSAPGDFGRGDTVLPARRVSYDASFYSVDNLSGRPSPPEDPVSGKLQALLAPDGQALVTSGWYSRAKGGDTLGSILAITGGLETGMSTPERLGSPCKPVDGVTPLLASGRLGAAWTDNLTRVAGDVERPVGHGVVHLALPAGAPPPAKPAPHARLTVRRQALKYAQALKARASCDRACELRAFVLGRHGEEIAVGSASLKRRGSTPLKIATLGDGYHIGGGRSGPVKVNLHACAPGSTSMSATRATAQVDLIPPKPFPVLSNIEAHRDKRAIVVTWTVDQPGRGEDVYPELHGRGLPDGFSADTRVSAGGRQVTMRVAVDHPERVTSVTLTQFEPDPPRREREHFVRVK